MFGINMFIHIFALLILLIKINLTDNSVQAPYLFLCYTNMGKETLYGYLRRKISNFSLSISCRLLCIFFG
jgi:hypothetical protein